MQAGSGSAAAAAAPSLPQQTAAAKATAASFAPSTAAPTTPQQTANTATASAASSFAPRYMLPPRPILDALIAAAFAGAAIAAAAGAGGAVAEALAALRAALICALALAALPTLVSTAAGTRALAAAAERALDGDVALESASLGWLLPLDVRGVEIYDSHAASTTGAAGSSTSSGSKRRLLLSIGRVTTAEPLYQILMGGDVTLTLAAPVVDLTTDAAGELRLAAHFRAARPYRALVPPALLRAAAAAAAACFGTRRSSNGGAGANDGGDATPRPLEDERERERSGSDDDDDGFVTVEPPSPREGADVAPKRSWRHRHSCRRRSSSGNGAGGGGGRAGRRSSSGSSGAAAASARPTAVTQTASNNVGSSASGGGGGGGGASPPDWLDEALERVTDALRARCQVADAASAFSLEVHVALAPRGGGGAGSGGQRRRRLQAAVTNGRLLVPSEVGEALGSSLHASVAVGGAEVRQLLEEAGEDGAWAEEEEHGIGGAGAGATPVMARLDSERLMLDAVGWRRPGGGGLTLRRDLAAHLELTPGLAALVLGAFNPLLGDAVGVQGGGRVALSFAPAGGAGRVLPPDAPRGGVLRVAPVKLTVRRTELLSQLMQLVQAGGVLGTLATAGLSIGSSNGGASGLLGGLTALGAGLSSGLDFGGGIGVGGTGGGGSSGTLDVWTGPMIVEIGPAGCRTHRVDMLLGGRVRVSLWGWVDAAGDQMHMRIGLPAATLALCGVKGLPDDYVMPLDLGGTVRRPVLDAKAAVRKIAALSAAQLGRKLSEAGAAAAVAAAAAGAAASSSASGSGFGLGGSGGGGMGSGGGAGSSGGVAAPLARVGGAMRAASVFLSQLGAVGAAWPSSSASVGGAAGAAWPSGSGAGGRNNDDDDLPPSPPPGPAPWD